MFSFKGLDPLILSEEQREMRRYQRIEEIRNSNGFSPHMSIRQEGYLPDLSRNLNADLNKLFMKRNNNPDFYAFNREINNPSKKAGFNFKFKADKKTTNELNDSLEQENDCAICMDMSKNSVLRPCNHMVTCFKCSNLLLNRQDNCPVCRERITEVIKVFMS